MPRAARLYLPRERRASWRIDFTLLFAAFALFGFGCLALRSVGIRSGENFLSRHLLMAGLGLGPFGVFYFVRPDWWRRSAWTLYGLNLVILAAVLFMGTSTNGAQRWLDLKFMQFQPSELAKMMALLTLASFLAARQDTISRVSTFILSFVHVAVPAFLIGMQPHYGGALVLIVIWLCVCVAGNVPLKFIAAAVLLLGLGGVAATQIPGALHGYHLRRLQAMQGEDRQGTNFQQDKAQVALAVGGLTGAGLFKGAQRLPEQENDFIFTVVGEDVGLAGSALVLGAFAFFFFRIWLVMVEAVEANHRMIAAGVLGLLAFHTIVNIGMVLQLLPVVGLWLPFFSAGGTALWLCMACVGLLLRVGRETRKRGF
jgi:rod shape determining protein RodA